MSGNFEDHLESKQVERAERAKKVYRYISDVARRLSDTTTGSQVISDLFTTAIETQRQKLRDNCEKLFFLDPINYGKKSLELLWRKVYYDTISAAKKLRENNNAYDNYIFTHIICGIGHFHNFITRIQSDMNVDVKGLDYLPLYIEDDSEEYVRDKPSDEEYQLGKSVIYTCLIYLGDLSRYQVEIFDTFEPSIAVRYYLQAAQIDLSSGMPYNQLGNLYLGKNYNLDSVYYYIHCLSSITPFDGAIGNLTKIFEKNCQLSDFYNDSDTLSQTEHMQVTVANFLSLIEIWYFEKDDDNIPKICNSIAHQFKIAMEFTKIQLPDINKDYNEYIQAVEEENINPSYLNSSIIHKIIQICLLTIAKLNETNEAKAFTCKAFTLAFLSQILQKLLRQLKVIGLKNPAEEYDAKFKIKAALKDKPNIDENENTQAKEPVVINGKIESIDETVNEENNLDSEIKFDMNGDNKNGKKFQTKRRRRRRVASSDSSDISDGDTENSIIESDKSDSEENDDLSDSTCPSDDEDSNISNSFETEDTAVPIDKSSDEDENETNGHGDITNETKTTENINHEDLDVNEEKINIQALQEFLVGDNFLPSIKLLQDWALTEKDLILSCGESGEALFQCVIDLLNIFTYYFSPKGNDSYADEIEHKIFRHARSVAKKLKLEYKSIPLPEDINLRGTNICKFDKDAAEWQTMEKFQLSVFEENIIRILHFIDYGHHIAKIIPRIRFNRSMKIFYLKKILPPKVTTKLNHKRSREWHNSKKQTEPIEGGLLRRLGRLWLASQVRELERTGQADIPSFLAVDTATLHEHLRRVKQLLAARNFIFLVPKVVLQELDELKRERSSARNAIRWLETQLKSGSRFLKTQRPGQSKPLHLLKYPRKAPQHVHNFIQILEFCNHFIADDKQSQGGNGDPDNLVQGKSTPFLILLVGNEPGKNEEQYKEFSLIGAAQAAGISVEYIGDFYTKWRQTLQKTGKKR